MSARIIKGAQIEDNVRMGVGEYFWRTADKFGDRICQIDAYTDKKESFAQVRTRALRVAMHLRKIGIQPQDVVMVCCDNDMDCIVPVLAAFFLGAYVMNIIPVFELHDIQYMLNISKPKVIFVVDDKLGLFEEAIKSMDGTPPQICIIEEMHEIANIETDEERSFKPVKVCINDTAFILCSSGTTAMPKGICFSHLSVLAVACRLNGDQKYLMDVPIIQFDALYWNACVWLTAFCIISAQPKIVGPKITAEKFYELVDKYKITCAFVPYSTIVDLANIDQKVLDKHDVSSLKLLTSGGASVDPTYIQKLRRIFANATVNQLYAATEIGCGPFYFDASDKAAYESKLKSVGKITHNVQVKIVDITTGELLGPNSIGELLVKSPYTMNGFASNQDSSTLFDADGFIKTGDLAYYDDEEYFYITDRMNQIIKYGLFRIPPTVIEDVLKNHPAVREAAVFGIPHPVDEWHPAACVTLAAEVSAQELCDHVARNLPETYRLRAGIKILSEMPKTSSGKIFTREVRRLFMGDPINEAAS